MLVCICYSCIICVNNINLIPVNENVHLFVFFFFFYFFSIGHSRIVKSFQTDEGTKRICENKPVLAFLFCLSSLIFLFFFFLMGEIFPLFA